MLVKVVNFFKNGDFIKVNLKVDPKIDPKIDLEVNPQLKLEYNFRKHQ